MTYLKQKVTELLNGCILKNKWGEDIYTPDGKGYYPAIWTRDFAYMVEYAGDLIDKSKVKTCIEMLLANADKNGWIPDRVNTDGCARYTAGDENFPALPNIDNGSFMVIAADAYLNMTEPEEAKRCFLEWKERLCRGVDCLPINEKGIIKNDSQNPHSPYGFTDCIMKTGLLSMETLLLWRAFGILVKWFEKCGIKNEKYSAYISMIEKNFCDIFLDESGMLLAATEKCRQIDLWASCYAVAIGFPIGEKIKDGIAKWIISHYDDVVKYGQLRHLPKDCYWERTFVEVERETYQNGAFWATPSGWLYETLARYDRTIAKKQMTDLMSFFEKDGIYEWINDDRRQLDSYVVSATNVYGVLKKYRLFLN